MRTEVDATSKILRIWPELEPSGTIRRETWAEITRLVREADSSIREVRIVFATREIAERQADAARYAGATAEFDGEAIASRATFEAREDFGIDEN